MKNKIRWSWVGVLTFATAIASIAPQARIFAQQTSSPPTTMPGPPGSPPIELTPDQRAAMARREEISARIFMMQPNQRVEARSLDSLDDDQLRTILAELDRAAIDAAQSAVEVLPVGPRRDRMELAWYSGRLARDGAYLPESRIPEDKAVETVLAYAPTAGPRESCPPVLLPNLSPPIESGSFRDTPLPMLFEMRVDAKADGTMEFAVLASMGGKKMLAPGIKVKSGEIASVSVPGGHVLAIHATLRDQKATEKEVLQRIAAARAQGQEAVNNLRIDMYPVFWGGPPDITVGGAPPAYIERMRTTQRNEAAIRALAARP